ncbi:alpha/beta hydrolase [Bailinhaonella thermotolerans]|uniref:Alpha/beta hydrolase n=1 Tax=Bailinhaonella thermotolerans TaxID=1070861 RepID=A0A3A4A2G5_9ACTN|nr:alpha/beta hydrolase [Bailinhaonella thermotolerans]RJL20849.1 alpha/beta hydrolase [Bailinhaonella thermotolerans]
MALHPQARAFLEMTAAAPPVPRNAAGIARMRAIDRLAERRGPAIELPRVSDTLAGGVPVRVYRPEAGDQPLPCVAYFHGGGWVLGSVAQSDPLCRDLAVRAGAVVVSADYRLAPEHVFPAAAEDACAVLDALFADPAAYTADPGAIAVCGDSAGGNLAAVAAAHARDAGLPLAHQVLVYPITDVGMATASYREYAAGYGLEADGMAWFTRLYAGGADPADPRLSPLRSPDLRGLAPATVITAECDVLRDEGEAYAAALAAAGVPVDTRRFDGMLHGFFALPDLFDAASAARDYAVDRLRAAFGESGVAGAVPAGTD